MQGLIGYLGGRFGVSQRDMAEMLETVFQVEISLGSIPAQEQRVSQALKQPVEAAQKYVQTQKAVNLDETGWHELIKNVWLWVCTTPSVTVFRIFQGRGGSGAEELLGEALFRHQSVRIATAPTIGLIRSIARCVGRISSAIFRLGWSAEVNLG